MNENRYTEMHYLDSGSPQIVGGNYMNFFDGGVHDPMNYVHPGPMHHQDMYWSMNTSAYKYGFSDPENASYYGSYEINDHLSRMAISQRAHDYPSDHLSSMAISQSARHYSSDILSSMAISQSARDYPADHLSSMAISQSARDYPADHLSSMAISQSARDYPADHISRMAISQSAHDYPSTMDVEQIVPAEPGVRNVVMDVDAIPEECVLNQQSNNPEAVWQDDIDPDIMTYEELLELGEAVGTESRGLSQELIDLLPTTKYKFTNIFSRKKSGERCVICQMRYKRGEEQMKLPCKHVYHCECISKWLSLNKICPVCNNEVFGEESTN